MKLPFGIPTPLLMALAAAAVLLIIRWGVVSIFDAGRDAKEAEQWRHSINDYIAGSDRSWKASLNLETGLNDFRPAARELDKKVTHATSNDTGNRYNADSVQRAAERIAAGEAARRRFD